MDINYITLKRNRSATNEEVKAAYIKLAKQYHPDKYASNPLVHLAEEQFKKINDA